ncbi:hypothetical protein V6N13_057159 [Hibiscus sabdariffa]
MNENACQGIEREDRPDERSTELHPYSPGPCTSLSPGGWPPILDLPIFKKIPGSIWFSIKQPYLPKRKRESNIQEPFQSKDRGRTELQSNLTIPHKSNPRNYVLPSLPLSLLTRYKSSALSSRSTCLLACSYLSFLSSLAPYGSATVMLGRASLPMSRSSTFRPVLADRTKLPLEKASLRELDWSDARSEPDRPERESQERVDERRSPIRGWSVKTSVEALSFQTHKSGTSLVLAFLALARPSIKG